MIKNSRQFILPIFISGVWFYISQYQLRFSLQYPPVVIGLLVSSIMVGGIVWFILIFIKNNYQINNLKFRDLLIGSICAFVAPIIWLVISGPGQAYYYKIVYPIGESEVQQGVGGSFCLTTAIIGLGLLVYTGWMKAKEIGWSQYKYIFLVIGIFFTLFISSILIGVITMSNQLSSIH